MGVGPIIDCHTLCYSAPNQMKALSPQSSLSLPMRGGRRRGAARKPAGERAGVSHARRATVTRHTPAHVTLRVLPAMARLRSRSGGRLVHYSIQGNHLHLLIEADDTRAVSRFVQGLKVRIAPALNRRFGRTGKVFADRFHMHVLRTPREARNALLYVFNNDLHHGARRHGRAFDYFTSAPFFDGWREGSLRWPKPLLGPPPVVPARSWLMTEGWRRGGLLGTRETDST
jgi:REP element-mobilizing transposase RayT